MHEILDPANCHHHGNENINQIPATISIFALKISDSPKFYSNKITKIIILRWWNQKIHKFIIVKPAFFPCFNLHFTTCSWWISHIFPKGKPASSAGALTARRLPRWPAHLPGPAHPSAAWRLGVRDPDPSPGYEIWGATDSGDGKSYGKFDGKTPWKKNTHHFFDMANEKLTKAYFAEELPKR